MDCYPDFDDVFDPDWFIDEHYSQEKDDGVLGDDPFDEGGDN